MLIVYMNLFFLDQKKDLFCLRVSLNNYVDFFWGRDLPCWPVVHRSQTPDIVNFLSYNFLNLLPYIVSFGCLSNSFVMLGKLALLYFLRFKLFENEPMRYVNSILLPLLGRSNVGKSSLLNALTRQWGVVRTSDKPGLTQVLSFS